MDVLRTSETDIPEEGESKIHDFWNEAEPRSLSSSWTGRAVFNLLRPEPPPCQKWIDGRLTRAQQADNSSRSHLAGSVDQYVQETKEERD